MHDAFVLPNALQSTETSEKRQRRKGNGTVEDSSKDTVAFKATPDSAENIKVRVVVGAHTGDTADEEIQNDCLDNEHVASWRCHGDGCCCWLNDEDSLTTDCWNGVVLMIDRQNTLTC